MCNQFDGLVQNYSNPIANALELLQSCTKPSILPVLYVLRLIFLYKIVLISC